MLVIQVLNGTGNQISNTDLDDCLKKIEERTGFRFSAGEVVHTFGQTTATITINGVDVRYEEPSRISEDRNIKVVFFKENLSTGWDCPRAETMMSFRRAKDATYIAQLLGRMVRTPMQMRIQVDEVLNDVHLYLPYFDADTVKEVVEALQSTEGGNIPTDVYGESLENKTFDTLTIRPVTHRSRQPAQPDPNQMSFYPVDTQTNFAITVVSPQTSESQGQATPDISSSNTTVTSVPASEEPAAQVIHQPQQAEVTTPKITPHPAEEVVQEDVIDREAVMKFINDYGLLTYDVRTVRINNYLTSLFKLARLLVQSDLCKTASKAVVADIVKMIHSYAESMRQSGKYDELADMVQQFKLSTQIFDVFGETVDNFSVHDLFTTTDTDIDRQFRLAETKLGNEGVGNEYGRQYFDVDDPNMYKIDVIIFAADESCIRDLHTYAEKKFHDLNDQYRRYIAKIDSDRIRRQYDSVVSDGDVVSKHNFRLPETIQVPHEDSGVAYRNHLFINSTTGTAVMNLNTWEAGVIAEEEKRKDFVCWLRNPSKKSWSLCIPYEVDSEISRLILISLWFDVTIFSAM